MFHQALDAPALPRFNWRNEERTMAEVYIAAAPQDGEKARVLAEALTRLGGFDAEGGAPRKPASPPSPKTPPRVVALFSRASAHAPWLTALGHRCRSKASCAASILAHARPRSRRPPWWTWRRAAARRSSSPSAR